MGNIHKALEDEILAEMDELKKMEVGSDTYKTTVDGISKLYDRAIEIDKMNLENDLKYDAQEFERDMRVKELDSEKKDRTVRNVLTGLGIAVPAGLTVWGTLKSFKFEETGTVTTLMGRGFINKLLPKK